MFLCAVAPFVAVPIGSSPPPLRSSCPPPLSGLPSSGQSEPTHPALPSLPSSTLGTPCDDTYGCARNAPDPPADFTSSVYVPPSVTHCLIELCPSCFVA